MLGQVKLVRQAAVAETRLELDREPHRPPDHPDVPDQPVPAGGRALDDRHEVVHLADPVRGHEPGDQYRGIGQVQLPGHVVVAVGRDPVEPAPPGVEQGGEDARGIEPRAAEPVEDAVGAHQCRRLQVADEPMIADVRITSHGLLLRSGYTSTVTSRTAGHIIRYA